MDDVVEEARVRADAPPAVDLRGRHALVVGPGGDVAAAVARALARAGAAVSAGEGDVAALAAGVEPAADRVVDILVTCAPAPRPAALTELTGVCWRAAMDDVATAAMVATRDALPLLRGNGGVPGTAGSSIVHIGSTAGLRGEAGAAAGAAAAAGLAGLTRSLAKELGPRGVRVNMVAAGPVADGRPDQVAAIAVFLASDASAGINGEVIVADGAA